LRRTDTTYRAVSACWRRTGQRRCSGPTCRAEGCSTIGDAEDIDRS